jgi:hypothetical protein
MSNWIDYDLDALAGSPAEINQIEKRLQQPSAELVAWVAEKFGDPSSDVAHNLKEFVGFKAVRNLGYVDPDVNQARRFKLSFKSRSYGVVDSHLFGVSREFPSAIFLLTYRDMMASYAGKRVIRAGEVVQEVHDGDQKVQSLDWILIDIFPPFLAEYHDGLPFGSLWQEWLDKMAAAVGVLKEQSSPTPTSDVPGGVADGSTGP